MSAAAALLRSAAGAHVVAFVPSRDLVDDLAAAAGGAGARFPSVSMPWGVSDAFEPLNWPAEPVHARPAAGGGPAAAAAAAAAFYARHLLHPPSAAPPSGGEAAAAEAEAAAGVADAADVALVVPWCCAARALELFAGARVRRFDSAADCWSSAVRVQEAGAPGESWQPLPRKVNVCATRYARLVDATSDAELWALPRGTVLLPRLPAGAPSVDVLLHGNQGGAAELVAGLCRRLWRGRDGPLGDWAQAGARKDMEDADALPPLQLLAAPASARGFAAGVELRAVRLPVHRDSRELLGSATDDDDDDDAAWAPGERARALAAARAALAALAPTGLVPAGAAVAPLSRALAVQADADLARAAAAGDAAAARAVLPLPPAAVLAALRPGGAVAAGAVALVQARLGCDPGRLLPTHRVRRCADDDAASFEALHAATARAHTLVFFCNHGGTASPARAAAYAHWLRQRQQPPPRVRVLAGGMGALVAAAAAGGEDMGALFATYDAKYID